MSLIIQIEGKNQVKKKGFCPNPVAQYGIPEYADSDSFPDEKEQTIGVTGGKNKFSIVLEVIRLGVHGSVADTITI